jgi:hypothetical protein
VRDHPDIDWLAVGGQSSALSGMVSARRAVLARRSTPPFWLRSFDALQRSKVWLEEQNRSLATALTQSESIVSEQTAWISALEEARIWHEQQHAALEEALRQRDAVVADQSAWISTLEEARKWHEQQNRDLHDALGQRDAQAARDTARSTEQIRSLELRAGESDARLLAQEAWLSDLERSRAWRILRLLNLTPGARRPDH